MSIRLLPHNVRLKWLKGLLPPTVAVILSVAGRTDAESLCSEDTLFSISWKNAVELVKNGDLHKGFHLLDSLRQSSCIPDDSLLFYYARIVSRLFLPFETGKDSDTLLIISDIYSRAKDAGLTDDETEPGQQGWYVSSPKGDNRELPSFSYGWLFDLRERMKLQFPVSPRVKRLFFENKPKERFVGELSGPLVFNPEAEPWKMQMKISVDCSRTQLPLSEYLCTIVCNNFDVIEDKKTPFLEKSISLRCYNRSTFRGVPNTFYAFVAFDRFFDASGDPEKRAKKRSASSILRVRYVISVKTSQAVEDKAEVILRTVLEKFKS